MERSSGILMPVSSLPSPYGIGTFGKEAYAFVDFLVAAKQSYWQMLPLGPITVGNSPYQSPSASAGNPYYIDPDLLVKDGLLTKKEITAYDWGKKADRTDYGLLFQNRLALLRKAVKRGLEKERREAENFLAENEGWLPDYALFMALKDHFEEDTWQAWPDEAIRMHEPGAIAHYRELLSEEVEFHVFCQYLFFKQWKALREYAHEKGIRIIGDMPLYVALESADVWAAPGEFLLDEKNVPVEVAGVPPDYFSEDGQLWGNPLYDYNRMRETGFGWWIRRIAEAEKLYDVIRIDHFRGLESFWAVPYGEKTAKNGRWIKAPGMELIQVLKNWFPKMEFIAEDLGVGSPEVEKLLADSGFPGMRVLEFAFDAKDVSTYLPHAHIRHCVCYAATHDNDTLLGWKAHGKKADIKKAEEYLGIHEPEGFAYGILRGGMASVADLFMMQMQDVLELSGDARMNTPGTMFGNWEWRMLPGQAGKTLAARLAKMTLLYDRGPRNH